MYTSKLITLFTEICCRIITKKSFTDGFLRLDMTWFSTLQSKSLKLNKYSCWIHSITVCCCVKAVAVPNLNISIFRKIQVYCIVKNILEDISLFVGPLVPLFQIFGEVGPAFIVRVDPFTCRLTFGQYASNLLYLLTFSSTEWVETYATVWQTDAQTGRAIDTRYLW